MSRSSRGATKRSTTSTSALDLADGFEGIAWMWVAVQIAMSTPLSAYDFEQVA